LYDFQESNITIGELKHCPDNEIDANLCFYIKNGAKTMSGNVYINFWEDEMGECQSSPDLMVRLEPVSENDILRGKQFKLSKGYPRSYGYRTCETLFTGPCFGVCKCMKTSKPRRLFETLGGIWMYQGKFHTPKGKTPVNIWWNNIIIGDEDEDEKDSVTFIRVPLNLTTKITS